MAPLAFSTVEQQEIQRLAELLETSAQEAVMTSVRSYLEKLAPAPGRDGARVVQALKDSGVLGMVADAPSDLSSNKAHLQGYGE